MFRSAQRMLNVEVVKYNVVNNIFSDTAGKYCLGSGAVNHLCSVLACYVV